jgi:hypothetical protein
MHGGTSRGPITAAGVERSRKARWVHGYCSAESKQQRRAQNQEVRALIRALRQAASLLRPEPDFPD